MTAEEIADVVDRQLVAEAKYLEAVASFPCIRAERRRILEEAERELAIAVDQVLRAGACRVAGRPAGGAGLPDVALQSESP